MFHYLGNFNFDSNTKNALTTRLLQWVFTQQVQLQTHKDGNIIDHVYISEALSHTSFTDLHYVYYSDHQGIFVTIVEK